jgi:poly-gamma-glutamate biosynthesis protein PgsC/CapC
MDHTGRVSLTLAIGIAISLFYSRRTGWACGGLVSPGLLAMQAADPLHFAAVLALSVVLAAILRLLSKFFSSLTKSSFFSLYGRERVGAALLLALAFRLVLRPVLQGEFAVAGIDALWIGWAAPGLIAADIDRQGMTPTLAAVTSAGLATAFVAELILSFRGFAG